MKRKKYLEMRAALMGEAQELLNSAKFEELKAKKAEIEKLDTDYETAATEQANLAALEDKVPVFDMENQSIKNVESNVIASTMKAPETSNEKAYEDIFAKAMLLRPLNEDEIKIYNEFNPENVYTHTTANTQVVIPTTVVGGIMEMAQELHPVLGEVTPTRIKGQVKYAIHKSIDEGDADYYEEGTDTADEKNTFGELILNGKELSKAVTVSWKLQAMAISEFIPFLKRELGQRVGAAKARAFFKGTGGDTKYPQGVITAINAEVGTPQKVTYEATGITYKDLTSARAKIASSNSAGAKIFASSNTIWNELANILDLQGRPIFVPDVTAGGVGRIFGMPVLEEDALGDGEIVIGNFRTGYKENISEDEKLVTDDHAKGRKTDFVMYTVHDAGVIDLRAFVYIVKGA